MKQKNPSTRLGFLVILIVSVLSKLGLKIPWALFLLLHSLALEGPHLRSPGNIPSLTKYFSLWPKGYNRIELLAYLAI